MDDNPTMWKSLPSFISVLVSVSFVLSITYDWGYFYWLDVSFSEIPTSLSDHTRSTLVWMPTVGILIFSLLILELYLRRIEQGKTEQELFERTKNPKFTKLFLELPDIIIAIFSLIFVVTYVLWALVSFQKFLLFSMIFWFPLSRWFFSHKRILERTTPIFRICVRIIPAVMIFFVYLGVAAANHDVSVVDVDTLQEIKVKTESKTIKAKVLRSFEKAILLSEPVEKEIQIISWNEVDSIKFSYREFTFSGLLGKNKEGKEEKPGKPKDGK